MPHVITVFGSARPQPGDQEYDEAYSLGRRLAEAGFTVCNGGYGGSMEAVARGAKEANGATVGVTFSSPGRQANQWIDREIQEPDLPRRLLKLVELGDGYIVLKGGTGTLLELACVWEFINKGIIREKPIVVLGPFWHAVVDVLRQELVWEGIGECTRFITEAATSDECVRELIHRLRLQTR